MADNDMADNDYLDSVNLRIQAIVGDLEALEEINPGESIAKYYAYLKGNLTLPCEVKTIEDLRWEEYFVFGPGSEKEYAKLRKTQPSCQDTFELLDIQPTGNSRWCLSHLDMVATVQRKSDGKKFDLGLSELEATDKESANHQILNDYVVFFVNYI